MAEPIDKDTFIAEIERDFADFTALLTLLHEEQLTTSGVNGAWSVKDNIVHITAWHNQEIKRLHEIKAGGKQQYGVVWTDEAIDEFNERVYQEHKSQPISEAMAQLRTSYQQLFSIALAMSPEELNTPLPIPGKALAWQTIAGNTYEHYQEHAAIIQEWLARSTK